MTFEIATLDLPNSARIGICAMPGRSGALDADMIELLRWKPDAVLSMTGNEEMARAGAAELPLRLAAAGIAWRQFPVTDLSDPAGGMAQNWSNLSDELHAILDHGGAVLTHCYAGRGRAGMVALRLLVERGEEPEAALKRIRKVRTGAVEAASQFH